MYNSPDNKAVPGSPGWSRGPSVSSSRQSNARRVPSRSKNATLTPIGGIFAQMSEEQDQLAAKQQNNGDASQQAVQSRIKETKKNTSISHSRNAAQSSWLREWSAQNHTIKVTETELRAATDVFQGKYESIDSVDSYFLSELGITDGTVTQWGDVVVEKEYQRSKNIKQGNSLLKKNALYEILSKWLSTSEEAEKHRNILRALLYRLRGGIDMLKKKQGNQSKLIAAQLEEAKDGMSIELDIFQQEQRQLEVEISEIGKKIEDTPKETLKDHLKQWLSQYIVKKVEDASSKAETPLVTVKETVTSPKKSEYIRANMMAETIVSGFDPDAVQRSLGQEVHGASIDSMIFQFRRREAETKELEKLQNTANNTNALFLTEPSIEEELFEQAVLQDQQTQLEDPTRIPFENEEMKLHQQELILVYLLLCCVYCAHSRISAIPGVLYNYQYTSMSTIDRNTCSNQAKEVLDAFLKVSASQICTSKQPTESLVNMLSIPLGVSASDLQFVKTAMLKKSQTIVHTLNSSTNQLVIPIIRREDLYALDRATSKTSTTALRGRITRKDQSRKTPVPRENQDMTKEEENFDDVLLAADEDITDDSGHANTTHKLTSQSLNICLAELYDYIPVIPPTVLEALYPLTSRVHPVYVYMLCQVQSIIDVLKKKGKQAESAGIAQNNNTTKDIYKKCVDMVQTQRSHIYDNVSILDEELQRRVQNLQDELSREYKCISRDIVDLDEEMDNAVLVVEQTYKKMKEEVRQTQQKQKLWKFKEEERLKDERLHAEQLVREELAMQKYQEDMLEHKKRVEERRQLDKLKLEERLELEAEEQAKLEKQAAQQEAQRLTVAGPIDAKIKRDVHRAQQSTRKQELALEKLQDEQLEYKDMVRKMRALGVNQLPLTQGAAFQPMTGYNEDRLNQDPRYKQQNALAQAGIANNAYARQVFQSMGEGRERKGLQNQWSFNEKQ